MQLKMLIRTIKVAIAAIAVAATNAAQAEVVLPNGYTPIDYIESHGAQWIDTGITGKSTTKLTMDCLYVQKIGSGKTYDEFFGSQMENGSSSYLSFSVYVNGNGYIASALNTGTSGDWLSSGSYTPVAGTRYVVELDAPTKVFTFSSKDASGALTQRSKATHTKTVSGETFGSILLCGVRNNGSDSAYKARCSYLRLYSVKISEGGSPVRDFVPCRNPDGEAGLWDLVNGEFYGNKSGVGHFSGSDYFEPVADGDALLTSITFTGSQYINTGYNYKAYDVFELDCLANATGLKSYATFFGSRGTANDKNGATVFATRTSAYHTLMWRSGTSYEDGNNAHEFPYGSRVTMTTTEDALAWIPADGTAGNGYTLPTQTKHEGGVRPLFVFAVNELGKATVDANSPLAGKFYSFKVTSQDGTVPCDLVPYRKKDGTVCVYDVANGKAITITGSGVKAGAAVSDKDGVRTFYDGVIDANDLWGFAEFAKDSSGELDASAVTAYPGPLTLKNGTFSLSDGAAKDCTVDGTLTLEGGSRVRVDVGESGCDCLMASEVNLSAASEENPVIIDCALWEGATDKFCLLQGGLKTGDEAKFRLEGLAAELSVENGALVAEILSTTPIRAEWTGKGDRAVPADAGNWICYNAKGKALPDDTVPTEDTTIDLGSATSFNWPAGQTLECREIIFGSTIALTADCDWSGMTEYPGITTLDLKGYSLTLVLPADPLASGTITDTNTEGKTGELHLVVPQGKTVTNSKIALKGSLKLVKDGPGTFTPNLKGQTYTGGTEIVAGIVKLYNDATANSTTYALKNLTQALGVEGSLVVIRNGGTFDMNGVYDTSRFNYELAGGTICNSKGQTKDTWGSIGNITVSADSVLDLANSTVISHPITASKDGLTLTVKLGSGKYCYLPATLPDCKLDVVSGGWLVFKKDGKSIVANGMDLDVSAAIELDVDLTVRDYTSRYEYMYLAGSKKLAVTGTFTPVSDYFYGCTMQNGSTIDLSAKTGAWSTTTKEKSNTGAKGTVDFEEGATITLNLGERTFKEGEKIIDWPAAPNNVTFVPSVVLEGKLTAATDGLYLVSDVGGETAWTGEGDGKTWSADDNWSKGAPKVNGNVTIDLADGGELDFDKDFALDTLTIGAEAGAFTHTGTESLGIQTALTNLSSAAQTFLMPMVLGSSGSTFSLFTAGSLALTGAGKTTIAASEFVKTGAGELLVDDTAIATAGNVLIEEGTVKLNYTGKQTAKATEGEIRILGGTRLDLNQDYGSASTFAKCEATHGKTIYVEGAGPDGLGAIYNSNPAEKWGAPLGHVVLTGDALIGGAGHFAFRALTNSRIVNPLVEGGYTLTVSNDYVTAETLGWMPNFNGCTFALGGLNVCGKIQFEGAQAGTITNGVHFADGTTVRLYGATLAAGIPLVAEEGATVTMTSDSGASVMNGVLTVGANATVNFVGAGTVQIAGTLAGGGAITGANVAFSGNDACWQMTADAEGFTSKVDVGAAVEANPAFLAALKRVEAVYTGAERCKVFDVGPAGDLTVEALRSISLTVTDGDGATLDSCILNIEDGVLRLHIMDDNVPMEAVWAGKKSANLADPNNWTCYNAREERIAAGVLPLYVTTVEISGEVAFSCPAAIPFPCAELVLESVSLAASCDWSGFDLTRLSAKGQKAIDLAGHNLTLKLEVDPTVAVTITDTGASGKGGELHLVIPEGKTVTNTKIALKGSLKLVKDGEGTFVPQFKSQTYTGGTEIVGGKVNTNGSWGNDGMLGVNGSTITVDEGGTLDLASALRYNLYRVVLNGGSLIDSAHPFKGASSSWYQYDMLGVVSLEANSTMNTTSTDGKSIGFCASVAKKDLCELWLNGHTLDLTMRGGYLCGLEVKTPGTINFRGVCEIPQKSAKCNLTNAVLNAYGALEVNAETHLGDYINYLTGADSDKQATKNYTAKLYVHGRFKPMNGADGFRGCTLKDGATLDLSDQATTWNAVSAATKNGVKEVTFENGAKITVDLGGRTVAKGEKIVSWSAKPDKSVKFILVFGTEKAKDYRLVAEDDGLYYRRVPGTVIYAR